MRQCSLHHHGRLRESTPQIKPDRPLDTTIYPVKDTLQPSHHATSHGRMSDVLFSASGSHWGQPELNHFHVVDAGPFGWLPRLSKNGLKELKEHRLRVGDETARRLQSVIGEVTGNEWSRYNCETHRDLLLQGGKVQLGQFFTNLATVAQSWRLGDADSETSPLPVRRPIRSVQQRIRDPRILTGKPLEAAYSRILYPSTPDGRADVMEAQGATPQEIAAEREKPETITNAMILSFLESVLEFSKLRERMVAQAVKSKLARPQERMEWHLVPTPFSIAALECKCSSTNDGSLFFKRITYVNGSAQWKNASGLVYCSIEVRLAPVIRLCAITKRCTRRRPCTRFIRTRVNICSQSKCVRKKRRR